MRIMIVGAGLVGQYLCEKFSSEGQEVILIDRDKEKLQRLERELNILVVHGSGASARVLAEAGISKTDLFIAVTDSDEVNLVACFMSRQYDVTTRIARVKSEDLLMPGSALNEDALGIDLIISPDWAMAEEIIKLIHVSEAFDTAEFAEGQVMLLGYTVHEDHPFIGLSLFELGRKHGTQQYVMTAIIRDGETIIPRGEDVIQAGDKIYLMVLRRDMARVEQLFHFASRLPSRVFIIGGGDIGYMVARQLEELHIDIKIVEVDEERCEFLSENLAHSIVLNMDGLEAHDLLEEGIDRADLVIAVTDSATTNILASLLTKYHGTKRCITKITRHDFIPMLDKLGIDVALSPRQVAADMILRYVRRADIISVATILDTDAEVMEVTVPDRKRFDNVPLKDLGCPRGSVVGAIVRDREVFIPSGDSIIRPGDNLVIFFTKDAARDVEKFFNPDA
ncbi:Trk system potassium transport protein TrkA [Desulfolithobacter dissulfuricans]|uniref:Trk system potassium uptake protein TrkA n=2 Tax=Desulfolithobacter dissulfuricans TaxID=2795293 RepID=A0A915U2N3_9BACT|nr:Trk system potassium transport protein TrkA [Desulfolithobacter dissulfuricans]